MRRRATLAWGGAAALALDAAAPSRAQHGDVPERLDPLAKELARREEDIIARARAAAVLVQPSLAMGRAAGLPVKLPRSFDLVLNLRTAQVLGLNVPASMRLRATEVIE